MPATWKMYGVDANRDGEKDPYNPVDAIFAAARYLRAAGADKDLRRAIFAYNHADWYVDSVLLRARVIGGLPSDLVGSLTGLTQGRFPVHAKATYAGKLEKADQKRKIRQRRQRRRRRRVRRASAAGIDIFARKGAPAIAVNDGKIVRIGTLQAPRPLREAARRLRQHLHLRAARQDRQDLPGAQEARRQALGDPPRAQARRRRRPKRPPRRPGARRASAPQPRAAKKRRRAGQAAPVGQRHGRRRRRRQGAPVRPPDAPERPRRRRRRPARRGPPMPAESAPLGFDKRDFVTKRCREGARVIGGTVLGRIAPRHGRQGLPHALRDPPGRPRRPARRPEADPRRLEAARVDRDLPRRQEEPVRRRGRRDALDRPDPADEQGDADPARRQQPAHRRSTTAARPTSAAARSTAACWPRSSTSPPPA